MTVGGQRFSNSMHSHQNKGCAICQGPVFVRTVIIKLNGFVEHTLVGGNDLEPMVLPYDLQDLLKQ